MTFGDMAVSESLEFRSSDGGGMESDPHFTFRALAAGTCIGAVMCFANMYFGLQTGMLHIVTI